MVTIKGINMVTIMIIIMVVMIIIIAIASLNIVITTRRLRGSGRRSWLGKHMVSVITDTNNVYIANINIYISIVIIKIIIVPLIKCSTGKDCFIIPQANLDRFLPDGVTVSFLKKFFCKNHHDEVLTLGQAWWGRCLQLEIGKGKFQNTFDKVQILKD